jgi:hypothetical protein
MPPSPTTLTPGDRLALGALEATDEQAIVDYLDGYRRRRNPAPATYYRRFVLKHWPESFADQHIRHVVNDQPC